MTVLPRNRIRRFLVSVAVFGLAVSSPVAWSADALAEASLQSQRIFGYTDSGGTIVLTNLPGGDERASKQVRLIVGAREPEAGAPASRLALPTSETTRRWVRAASLEHHVAPALLYAVMATESGYNPRALSAKGARGLMQLMPDTSRSYGVLDPYDSRESIFAGARHLRRLLDEFGGSVPLAVAAYNAGSAAVVRYHDEVPPFPETQAYVPRVLDAYQHFLLDSTGAR